MTKEDVFPLPCMEETIQQLSGSMIFSCLDSAGAFHAIPVHPESKEKTAFCSPLGLYQFRMMAFGLKNSPAIYARVVEKALAHLPGYFHLVYLDNVIIYSKTQGSFGSSRGCPPGSLSGWHETKAQKVFHCSESSSVSRSHGQ